jgi:transcriptional regulator with XRE-family HTH domain
MTNDESAVSRRAAEAAGAFGARIRSRRKELKMRQDQLALATGVGRRFLIDLEAGKSSCHLGRSLLVAQALGIALGLSPADVLTSGMSRSTTAPDLPELPDLPDMESDEMEEPHGEPAGLL